jgi:hypothetical protein
MKAKCSSESWALSELHAVTIQQNRTLKLNILQFKEDEINKACSMHGTKRNAYRVFVGKPERERPVGRSIPRWKK